MIEPTVTLREALDGLRERCGYQIKGIKAALAHGVTKRQKLFNDGAKNAYIEIIMLIDEQLAAHSHKRWPTIRNKAEALEELAQRSDRDGEVTSEDNPAVITADKERVISAQPLQTGRDSAGERTWVECTVCHRRKKPIGRDSRDNGLCDQECEGYKLPPHPGHLWPEEIATADSIPRSLAESGLAQMSAAEAFDKCIKFVSGICSHGDVNANGLKHLKAHFVPAQPLQQEVERENYEALYNRVMGLLRNTKKPHGLCEPRERKACTHCNAVEKLDELIADYKGARIILAQPTPGSEGE